MGISIAVHHMMRQRQFGVINYIDDIFGIDLPIIPVASFDTLHHLLHDIGFDISLKKLERPSTRLNCLGILIDAENFTVSIPPEKIKQIIDVCDAWCQKSTKSEL